MIALDPPPDTFHLSLEFRTGAAHPAGSRLDVEIHKLHDADRYDDERLTLISWGFPYLNGLILKARGLADSLQSEGIKALAPRLDGSFLLIVYDRRADHLTIVTDRTGSLPLFHHTVPGRFVASSAFKRLFDQRGAGASRGFEPWTVAEFFYFRRVFNTRTYDRDIAILPGASIFDVSANGTSKRHTYWRINPDKLTLDQDGLAAELADALRASMQATMSDRRRYGLLLSGGLDARALLAASPQPPDCFTTTPKPNNELAVAAELAKLRGAPHHYIPRPVNLLDHALPPSVALSGGMTIFHEVPFLGYGTQITPHADTVFMGLALDIMFCGHYMPKSLVSFAGHQGWHFRLHELSGDLPTLYARTVSYRLKTTDPLSVIRPEHRERFQSHMVECIRQEMDEGREAGLSAYDLWEFTHLHNMARHYSLLMAQSVRTFAACRIPAFSNRLYDLCWRITAQDKANWAVYQKAIKLLDPQLMQVRNANTNIRADMPLRMQTAVKFARAATSRIFGTGGASPSWWDRSWPEPRQNIDVNPSIQATMRALPSSQALASTGLFDQDAIAARIGEHEARSRDHTILLGQLMTIDRALTPFAG
jgi:asparagine synthetase B (glutamine-hydrolysing)